MVERRLGRGLDFLLSGELESGLREDEIVHVNVQSVSPNPFQPRRDFGDDELDELARSIREHGVLQPVIVRKVADGYELVAGERRWRACKRIGRTTVPALVRAADDTQMLEIALVENLQRENLNAIDVARGYAAYMERLGLTQQEVAERLSKSRSGVANTLRLLELPHDLQELVSRGTLSAGHARALLSLQDAEAQRALARRILEEGFTVRATEAATRKTPGATTRAPREPTRADLHLQDLADQLKRRLGTKVQIRSRGERGRIVIEYFSDAELERLLDVLMA